MPVSRRRSGSSGSRYLGHSRIVGDHDDGRSFLVHPGKKVHDPGSGHRIEVAGRFVAEEEVGVVDECPGNGDPLLLAAGELARLVGIKPLFKPDRCKHLERPLPGVALPAPEDHRVLDVLDRREERDQVEVLEDEPDVIPPQQGQLVVVHDADPRAADVYVAGSRDVERSHDIQQGGLPGAGRPHDGDELPGLDIEGDAVECDDISRRERIDLRDVLKLNDCHGY